MTVRKAISLILVCTLALSIASIPAVSAENSIPDGTKRILVVETTDIHGYIMDVSAGSEDKFQYRMARIAHLINEARNSGKYDDVMLLDGGDLYQGTPVSYMTGGAVIRAMLDTMHYDAVGLETRKFRSLRPICMMPFPVSAFHLPKIMRSSKKPDCGSLSSVISRIIGKPS